MQYTLDDDNRLVPEPDWRTWHEWMMDSSDTLVDVVAIGEVVIRTQFIGCSQIRSEENLVFRTHIHGGELSNHLFFWRTWEEAGIGHDWVVRVALAVDELTDYAGKTIKGEERKMPCTS